MRKSESQTVRENVSQPVREKARQSDRKSDSRHCETVRKNRKFKYSERKSDCQLNSQTVMKKFMPSERKSDILPSKDSQTVRVKVRKLEKK